MKFWHLAAVMLTVAGCSGNPLNNGGPNPNGVTDTTVDLGGTTQVSADTSIVHYEKQDGSGNGYATGYTYDASTDSFKIDNLAFDGANVYTRIPDGSAQLPPDYAGNFKVYESAGTYTDPTSGATINQFAYRAIYAEGAHTKFVIVRTGSYLNYGFGGFVYSRSGGVTLPTNTGQALYAGKYAGLRDFDGKTGLNYTTGDMQMAIDFSDFNSGQGVRGQIFNRKIYDMNGTDITPAVLNALSTKTNVQQTALPTLVFDVTPDAMSPSGEITAGLQSTVTTNNGDQVFETGKYYAVLAGTNASEVAGVIVVTSNDPQANSVTARETGGFILQRQ